MAADLGTNTLEGPPPDVDEATAASREAMSGRLQELGLETDLFTHPPVFTVDEAAVHCGHIEGGHCKNLLLKDKGKQLYLVCCLAHSRIRVFFFFFFFFFFYELLV